MPSVLFANNASAALASSITMTSTTITLTTGAGAQFPAISGSNYFYATLTDSSNNLEVIKVTARAADVLTVVRGQEGTTPRAYAPADKVELRVTAAVMNSLPQLAADQTFSGANTFTNPPTLGSPLAVTSGGTGVTTSTGTGAGVHAESPTINNPTLTAPALGIPASGTLTNCNGIAPLLTAGKAQELNMLSWRVLESGGKLYFLYGGVGKMTLDSSGNLVVSGNITGFGTPGTPTP